MSYRNWRGEEYTVKKVNVFPKLFLARESLLCDIPAGDGKIANLFFQCKESAT